MTARWSHRSVPAPGTSDWNSAVTLVSDCSVRLQVLDAPEHAPPQPVKRVPPPADAVSVTTVCI